MKPVSDIKKMFEEVGYYQLELDGDETNGWQVDFWYKFARPDQPTVTLSGSLWYGNFKFTKD